MTNIELDILAERIAIRLAPLMRQHLNDEIEDLLGDVLLATAQHLEVGASEVKHRVVARRRYGAR